MTSNLPAIEGHYRLGYERLKLFTNRACIGGKRVVVGEPIVYSDRRRAVEPGEEG
jgi:hypothetical protein